MKKSSIINSLIILIALCSLAYADSISLYDATLSNELPNNQSEYILLNTYEVPGSASYMTEGSDGFTRIDTIASNATRYAYRVSKVAMDRTQGVNIDFTIRIYSSIGTYDQRGPFWLHINTSDKMGLQLYFRSDEIFSMSTDFLRRVSTSYDTTDFVDYNLYISGNSFTLSANSTVVLTDTLVNFPDDSIYFHAYPYMSFGDATTAASGLIDIASISAYGDGVSSLLPDPEPVAVPEPLSLILFVASLLGFGLKRFVL